MVFSRSLFFCENSNNLFYCNNNIKHFADTLWCLKQYLKTLFHKYTAMFYQTGLNCIIYIYIYILRCVFVFYFQYRLILFVRFSMKTIDVHHQKLHYQPFAIISPLGSSSIVQNSSSKKNSECKTLWFPRSLNIQEHLSLRKNVYFKCLDCNYIQVGIWLWEVMEGG